jgi:hypothetical protein
MSKARMIAATAAVLADPILFSRVLRCAVPAYKHQREAEVTVWLLHSTKAAALSLTPTTIHHRTMNPTPQKHW